MYKEYYALTLPGNNVHLLLLGKLRFKELFSRLFLVTDPLNMKLLKLSLENIPFDHEYQALNIGGKIMALTSDSCIDDKAES